MTVSRRRFSLLLASLALLAGCGDPLAPQIAGRWGGDNLEVTFKSGVTEFQLPCGGAGRLDGDIPVSSAGTFSREGTIVVTAYPTNYAYQGRISGAVIGNTMTLTIENLELSVDFKPPTVTLKRGQSGTFTLLCAQ